MWEKALLVMEALYGPERVWTQATSAPIPLELAKGLLVAHVVHVRSISEAVLSHSHKNPLKIGEAGKIALQIDNR